MVGAIYCPHELRLSPLQRSVDTRLSVAQAHRSSLVTLAYGADVRVNAGNFDDIFLFMKCTTGQGSVRQNDDRQCWRAGDIVPVSMNRATEFIFHREFSQISLRPDKSHLQALCATWIGHPLEEDLCFDLSPLSPQLASAWGAMLDLLGQAMRGYSAAAQHSLEEAMLGMLLAGHAHNYSAAMQGDDSRSSARLARRFEQLVNDSHEQDLSVAALARRLHVGIRTLQCATERHLDTTPSAYLRVHRLERVQRELSQAPAGTRIADVAYANGFVHLSRFAAFYKARFAERPSDTLARSRHGQGALD